MIFAQVCVCSFMDTSAWNVLGSNGRRSLKEVLFISVHSAIVYLLQQQTISLLWWAVEKIKSPVGPRRLIKFVAEDELL